jgi:dihydrofolate reductase
MGSLSLTRSLLTENLIDEIQIRTVPIILGKDCGFLENLSRLYLKLWPQNNTIQELRLWNIN